MPIPTSAQALVVRVDSNNTTKLVKEPITVPKPAKHQLLVKVSHVAQNPTDGEQVRLVLPPNIFKHD